MKSSWAFRYGIVQRQTTGFGITELQARMENFGSLADLLVDSASLSAITLIAFIDKIRLSVI